MEPRALANRFVEEWCELGTRFRVSIAEIYDAFEHWCRIRRFEAPSKVAFGRLLTSLGFASGRNGRERFRVGLRLARPGSLTAGGRVKVPDVRVVTPEGRPEPPCFLSPSTAEWWREVAEEYELEEHHLQLLTSAASMWDRMVTAREVLDREGSTFLNNQGNVLPRPEIKIEPSCAVVHARLLRELRLEDGEGEDGPRLPRLALPPTRQK